MIKFWTTMATALAAALMVSGTANATTFTLDETIDLTKLVFPGVPDWITGFNGYPDAWSAPFDLVVAPGDTIDLRATFLPGQSLTTGPHSQIEIVFESNTGTLRLVGTTSETLTLLDSGGSPLVTSDETLQSNPGNIVGDFNALTFSGEMPVTTYSGFEYQVHILTATSLDFGQPPGYVLSEFNAAQFGMLDNFDPVPEPSTWAIMLAGMFGAGGALRCRPRRAIPSIG